MLLTIARDPKLLRLLPYRFVSFPNRTSKTQQMTTQSTHMLALLYIILTTHFISQTCASHPLIQRCDVSIYTNKTTMLTIYSKDMSLCLVKHQPLWPKETRANKGVGYALHNPLQQTNTQVRLHQQKPAAQHQQRRTHHQANKRKVSSITSIAMNLPPLSSHSMQAACHNVHTGSEKTITTTVQEHKSLKKRVMERSHNPAHAHHEKTTETPKDPMHTLTRDKNLSSLTHLQETPKEAQHIRRAATQIQERIPAIPRSLTQNPTRDKNLLFHNLWRLTVKETLHIKTMQHRNPRTQEALSQHCMNIIETHTRSSPRSGDNTEVAASLTAGTTIKLATPLTTSTPATRAA